MDSHVGLPTAEDTLEVGYEGFTASMAPWGCAVTLVLSPREAVRDDFDPKGSEYTYILGLS